jgi:flavin prenyltransferase
MGLKKTIILAATGASGAIYFLRTLRALLGDGHRVELVVSSYALVTLRQETSFGRFEGSLEDWLRAELAEVTDKGEIVHHRFKDQTATIASGSVKIDGMVVVPCTMKTLAAIAHGFSGNLIERAADVCLKERVPLVLVPREAPYNLIHLENMAKVTRAGAIVVPASPAFYQHPKSFDDLGDFIAGRALKLLGIDLVLYQKWSGLTGGEE